MSDNGKGFDCATVDGAAQIASTTRGGNGIQSMRKRAQDMSGDFEIVSGNGKGTAATLRMRFAQQGPEQK